MVFQNASTRVIVTDAAGTRVRTLDLGRLGAGRHTIDAVREDDFGQPLQPGLYQFSVDARSGAESVSALTFVRGRVTGLAAAEDESASPEVRIGSLELPIDSLLEIRSVDEPK